MREISKLPSAPVFDEKLVRMVSDLLFLPDATDTKRKMFQILGNIAFLDRLVEKFRSIDFGADTKRNRYPRWIIISGGINPEYGNNPDSEETRLVRSLFTASGRDWDTVLTTPESNIIKNELEKSGAGFFAYLETKSTNMRDYFTNSKVLGFYDGKVFWRPSRFAPRLYRSDALVLMTTAEATLRAKLSAEAALPHVKVETISYDAAAPMIGAEVSREKWGGNETSRRFVWGEVLRLEHYAGKGDIKLDYSLRRKLRAINQAAKEREG